MKKIISSVASTTHADNSGAEFADIPEALRDYDMINFKVDKNKRPLWFGEKDGKNKRLRADVVLQAFLEPNNQDPKQKFNPEPASALWTKDDQETPVIVNGILRADKDKGEVYYQIEGSDIEVPRSELTWLPSNEDETKKEINELRQLADELTTELAQSVEELKQLTEVYAENERLKQRIAEQQQEIVGRSPLDIVEPPEGKFRRRWIKIAAHAGNLATLRSPSQWALATVQSRIPHGSRVYKYNEEEYIPVEDVKRGRARIIGGLAIAAAAGVAGYLIGKYTGNHNHYHEVKVLVPGPVRSGAGHDLVQNTLQPWGAHTHGAIEISLPKGYHVVENSINGHREIVNPHGQVIINHLKMTQTGAVSPKSLQELKAHGLVKAGQTHFRYWDNSGNTLNPKLPSAEHPGWNTHTATILKVA